MADPELIPPDEDRRMAAVRRYDVLDTPPDGAFERITALAARHFGVPIAIVTIVDTDRIWFKSHHGIDAEEIGRDPGLCASAILQDEPWIVEDARRDPRAMANPLVAGEMGLGFYAGAPLTTQDGFNLGTLCVIDQAPRAFDDADARMLADLAAIVMDELELRLSSITAVGRETGLREQAEELARALQRSLLPPELPELPGAEVAALYVPADRAVVGGDFYDAFQAGDISVLVVGDVSGKGAQAAAITGLARHTIRTACLTAASPAEVLQTLNAAMLLGRRRQVVEHFCTVLLAWTRPLEGGLAVELATGGHPPALAIRPDGRAREAGPTGPPAGWFADAVFSTSTHFLEQGDTLLLFTDGVIEARTAAGMVGTDGLVAALGRQPAGSAAAAIDVLERILARPDVEVRDDVAAVALRAT